MEELDKKFKLNIQNKSYVTDFRVLVLTRNITFVTLLFVFVEILDFSSFFKFLINLIGLILLFLLIVKYIIYDRNYILLYAYRNGYKYKLKVMENIDNSIYDYINVDSLRKDAVVYNPMKIKGLVKSFSINGSEKNTVLLFNFYEFTENQFEEFIESQLFFQYILNVYRKNFLKKIIIINIHN